MNRFTRTAWQHSANPIALRIQDRGADVTLSDISSVTYKVYEVGTTTDLAVNSPLNINACLFSTLRNGPLGPYTFLLATDPEEIPLGGTTYRYEFKFTRTDGRFFYVTCEVATLTLLTETLGV